MAKKIVIFGPDNSGKTTLANQISREFKFSYVHSLGPVDVDKMVQFMDDMLSSEENVVFDRFPIIEESIYGLALRGSSKFDCFIQEYISSFLKRVNLFIYCNPNLDTICKWGTREQMDGVKENISKIKSLYDDYCDKLVVENYPVVCYDYTAANGLLSIKERIKNL